MDDELLATILSMGVDEEQARGALAVGCRTADAALEFIFSGIRPPPPPPVAPAPPPTPPPGPVDPAVEAAFRGMGVSDIGHATAVWNDECVFCFATSMSPGGILTSLSSFVGYCPNHAVASVTAAARPEAFVRIIRTPRPSATPAAPPPPPDPTKLVVEGKPEVEYDVASDIVLLPTPGLAAGIPLAAAPGRYAATAAAVVAARGALAQQQTQRWELDVKPSRHAATIPMLPDPTPVPPSGWVCAVPGCGISESLWVNLSDGFVACGRAPVGGVGPAGRGHARKHWEETGRERHLVVKLGTITPAGADVYSYAPDEDDSVTDPALAAHMARLGVDVAKCVKSAATTTEMSVDLNFKHEWSRITEADATLPDAAGEGGHGLANLGNTCYMASALQVLMATEPFALRYRVGGPQIMAAAAARSADGPSSFDVQMSKLAAAIAPSPPGTAMPPPEEREAVKPRMLRHLVGRGHAEFATERQQDAEEFVAHVFSLCDRASRGAAAVAVPGAPADPARAGFAFTAVDVVSGFSGGAVQLRTRTETKVIALVPPALATFCTPTVPGEAAPPPASVGLAELIAAAFAPEERVVEDPRGGGMVAATWAKGFGTFPPYLLVQVGRFAPAPGTWQPQKLSTLVPAPLTLSLSSLRAPTPPAGVVVLPSPADGGAAASAGGAAAAAVKEEDVAALVSILGCSPAHARAALAATGSDMERAADWALSHEPTAAAAPVAEAAPARDPVGDGPGEYQLVGMVSHLGANTHSGHYVAHIRRGGRWVLINDEKVAWSSTPPFDLAYLYVYERADVAAARRTAP